MTSIHKLTRDGFVGRKRGYLSTEEKNKWLKLKGKHKYQNLRTKRNEYLNAVHDFQLMRGDTPFGAIQQMTGREAWIKNTKYEDKFYKEIGVAEKPRLWRLKLIKPAQNT